MEVVNLLSNQPRVFGTYFQFLDDCKSGSLPDYSFASDHHPDHNIRAGEIFIASIYNAIFGNPDLWKSTLLLVVYDEHGGIYDHVPPPASVADDTRASAAETGIGAPFTFDRLGVRVPAILISRWIPKATVIPGPENSAAGASSSTRRFQPRLPNAFLPLTTTARRGERTRPRSSTSFPIPIAQIRIVRSSMSTRRIQ
jgi:phospholipase C